MRTKEEESPSTVRGLMLIMDDIGKDIIKGTLRMIAESIMDKSNSISEMMDIGTAQKIVYDRVYSNMFTVYKSLYITVFMNILNQTAKKSVEHYDDYAKHFPDIVDHFVSKLDEVTLLGINNSINWEDKQNGKGKDNER